MSMDKKVALVTGSARGIGRAIALGLAGEGVRVVSTTRSRQDAAEEVVGAIKAAAGEAILCKANVGKDEEVKSMVDDGEDEMGRHRYPCQQCHDSQGRQDSEAHTRRLEYCDRFRAERNLSLLQACDPRWWRKTGGGLSTFRRTSLSTDIREILLTARQRQGFSVLPCRWPRRLPQEALPLMRSSPGLFPRT